MKEQARSSVGERFLDTEEVGGSIPPVPIGNDLPGGFAGFGIA